MKAEPNGEWVRYVDVIALLAQAEADKQNTTQYIADLQADRDALQRENERLKAPVSDEEWEPFAMAHACKSGVIARQDFDYIIASRAQATKGAQEEQDETR